MTTFTKDWGVAFNKANEVFIADIKNCKKAFPQAAAMLEELLKPATHPTAWVTELSAIDKISLAHGSDKDRKALPENLKLYKVALGKLEQEGKKLSSAIDQIVKRSTAKNGDKMPNPYKEEYPNTYRQLKTLTLLVKAICERAQNEYAGGMNSKAVDKIEQKKDKAKSNVKGVDAAADAALKAISDEASMGKFVLQFAPSFKSAMAKAAVTIQRMKASPDAATYNTQMLTTARDISQNLTNILKLKANPKFKNTSLAKKLVDPKALSDRLVQFANGDKKSVKADASADEVKALLAEFTDIYKNIATTYADVIAGRVK